MATPTFTCFSSLPVELRLQIWEEALSVRTVWAAYRNSVAEGKSDPMVPPFTMHFVGPKPFVVGQACREARQVMENTFVTLPSSRTESATTTHWINPDYTVVHFGDCVTGIAVLSDLLAEDASKLKHAAVRRYIGHLPQMICFSIQLEASCPHLRTLVIRQSYEDAPADDTAQRPLPAEKAAELARAPAYEEPGFGMPPNSNPQFHCLMRSA